MKIVSEELMLSTTFSRKFYAEVKKLGRFTNEKYFLNFLKRPNFFTTAQKFSKKIVENIDPKSRRYKTLFMSVIYKILK